MLLINSAQAGKFEITSINFEKQPRKWQILDHYLPYLYFNRLVEVSVTNA